MTSLGRKTLSPQSTQFLIHIPIPPVWHSKISARWQMAQSRFLLCLAFPTPFLRQLGFMIPREVPQECSTGNKIVQESRTTAGYFSCVTWILLIPLQLSTSSSTPTMLQVLTYLPTPRKVVLESLVLPALGFLLLPVSQDSQEQSVFEISVPLSTMVGIN